MTKPAKKSKSEVQPELSDSPVTKDHSIASDRQLLMAPLVMYGVIALAIVALIVTTTLVMNRNLSTIDDQVAVAQDRITALNNTGSKDELDNINEKSETTHLQSVTLEDNEHDKTSPAENLNVTNNIKTSASDVTLASITPATDGNIENIATSDASNIVVNNQTTEGNKEKNDTAIENLTSSSSTISVSNYEDNLRQRMAERNEILAKQDKKHLDDYKASQARQIKFLREQLNYQQSRLEVLEKRNQKRYETRATTLQRIQNYRQESLQRI